MPIPGGVVELCRPRTEADLDKLQGQYELLADQYIAWTRAGRKFYLSPIDVKLASHVQGDETGCRRCGLGIRQISVDLQACERRRPAEFQEVDCPSGA